MNHPLAALFDRVESDDETPLHALSEEAQTANLRSAWEHYSTPKEFTRGQFVKLKPGLSIFKDSPVVCLYVRSLDKQCPHDILIIQGAHDSGKWNKLDCIVARVADTGLVLFLPMDGDLLEAVTP